MLPVQLHEQQMQALAAGVEAGKEHEAQLAAELEQLRQQLTKATQAQQQYSQAVADAEKSMADSEKSMADSEFERNKLLEVSHAESAQHCVVLAISTTTCAVIWHLSSSAVHEPNLWLAHNPACIA